MHSSLYSSLCSAWLCSSLPFCHRHAVAPCFTSIPWLCLVYTPNACCHILRLCWDSSARSNTYMYIHYWQHTRPQVPTRELQFSSLGFSHNSQWEYLLNRLLAPSVSPDFINSLEHQLTLLPLGCFKWCHTYTHCQCWASHWHHNQHHWSRPITFIHFWGACEHAKDMDGGLTRACICACPTQCV